MKKNKKKKSWFNSLRDYFGSLTEPFEWFYLGFLASIGLTLGSLLLFTSLRTLIEPYVNFDIIIYSRIVFSIFYLFYVGYTYYFLDMKRFKILRNGFMFFVIIYIIAQIYLWIFGL